jgi:hypothetical protein
MCRRLGIRIRQLDPFRATATTLLDLTSTCTMLISWQLNYGTYVYAV